MQDQIIIEGLELQCHLGITEEERAVAQRVTVSMTLVPTRDFAGLRDDIRNAVDYHRVALFVQQAAAARPRRLIETLGVELAEEVLGHFPLQMVDLHLRKFVMVETASVGIRVRREKVAPGGRRG